MAAVLTQLAAQEAKGVATDLVVIVVKLRCKLQGCVIVAL
jgi:hypothetical protein